MAASCGGDPRRLRRGAGACDPASPATLMRREALKEGMSEFPIEGAEPAFRSRPKNFDCLTLARWRGQRTRSSPPDPAIQTETRRDRGGQLAALGADGYNGAHFAEGAMTGPDDKPEDDAAMRAKLDAIAAAIRSHRPAAATEPPSRKATRVSVRRCRSASARAANSSPRSWSAARSAGASTGSSTPNPLFIILFFLLGVAAAASQRHPRDFA